MNLLNKSRVAWIPILIVFVLMSYSNTASAQIQFGVAGGLNYTSIDDVRGVVEGSPVSTVYDARTGWHIGIFVDIAAGFLAIRPGVYYQDAGKLFDNGIPTGDEINDAFAGESGSFSGDDFSLVHLAVPVDLRLRLNLPLIKPYVFGGPELRLLQDGTIGQAFRDNLKKLTYGLNIGIGAEVGLMGVTLMPELRYAIDATSITEDEIEFGGVTFTPNEDHIAKSVMLRLGVIL